MKKYELIITALKTQSGAALYQIKSLIDISEHQVKVGDLGGFVQSEKNLSHEGFCWVCGHAQVYETALISGGAMVGEKAHVYGNAHVGENARVSGKSQIYGEAIVGEQAEIKEFAQVYGKASVFGKAVIKGFSHLYGTADVTGNTNIGGDAQISEGGFAFESDVLLTDIAFPSEENRQDPLHPRYEGVRLMG